MRASREVFATEVRSPQICVNITIGLGSNGTSPYQHQKQSVECRRRTFNLGARPGKRYMRAYPRSEDKCQSCGRSKTGDTAFESISVAEILSAVFRENSWRKVTN